eukprot:TRINITY_DN11955_c0_g1_i1.p1 TRINITY_DN11955_c0_g1~~TRINITY_DN11955_c0_g1_i1.p1  ORF type:complete len:1056 (+),score=252.66 TRINITY_DN11955_c0_g1_i1:78-3170(+)
MAAAADLPVLNVLYIRDGTRVELVEDAATRTVLVRKTVPLRPNPDGSEANEDRQLREVRALREAAHPHVVRLLSAQIVSTLPLPAELVPPAEGCDPSGRALVMLMEHAAGGDLAAALVSRGGTVPRHIALRWLTQLASALDYLHSRGLVHRDVKAANVLLTKEEFSEADVLLGDFGSSRFISSDELYRTQIGTPQYMAPEMWDNAPYGSAVDVWALGVLGYELINGRSPWLQVSTLVGIMREVTGGGPQRAQRELERVGGALGGALRRALSPDPQRRPSAAELLSSCRAAAAEVPSPGPLKVRIASGSGGGGGARRLAPSASRRAPPGGARMGALCRSHTAPDSGSAQLRSRSAPAPSSSAESDDSGGEGETGAARLAATTRTAGCRQRPPRSTAPELEFVLTPIQRRLFEGSGAPAPQEADGAAERSAPRRRPPASFLLRRAPPLPGRPAPPQPAPAPPVPAPPQPEREPAADPSGLLLQRELQQLQELHMHGRLLLEQEQEGDLAAVRARARQGLLLEAARRAAEELQQQQERERLHQQQQRAAEQSAPSSRSGSAASAPRGPASAPQQQPQPLSSSSSSLRSSSERGSGVHSVRVQLSGAGPVKVVSISRQTVYAELLATVRRKFERELAAVPDPQLTLSFAERDGLRVHLDDDALPLLLEELEQPTGNTKLKLLCTASAPSEVPAGVALAAAPPPPRHAPGTSLSVSTSTETPPPEAHSPPRHSPTSPASERGRVAVGGAAPPRALPALPSLEHLRAQQEAMNGMRRSHTSPANPPDGQQAASPGPAPLPLPRRSPRGSPQPGAPRAAPVSRPTPHRAASPSPLGGSCRLTPRPTGAGRVPGASPTPAARRTPSVSHVAPMPRTQGGGPRRTSPPRTPQPGGTGRRTASPSPHAAGRPAPSSGAPRGPSPQPTRDWIPPAAFRSTSLASPRQLVRAQTRTDPALARRRIPAAAHSTQPRRGGGGVCTAAERRQPSVCNANTTTRCHANGAAHRLTSPVSSPATSTPAAARRRAAAKRRGGPAPRQL